MKEGLIALQIIVYENDGYEKVINYFNYLYKSLKKTIYKGAKIRKELIIIYDFSSMLSLFNKILMDILYIWKYKILNNIYTSIKYIKHIFEYNKQNKVGLMNVEINKIIL